MDKRQQQEGVDITKVAPKQLQELSKAIETELQQLAQSYN